MKDYKSKTFNFNMYTLKVELLNQLENFKFSSKITDYEKNRHENVFRLS